MDERKWSKARALLKEALAVQQQALGEQHPDAAQSLGTNTSCLFCK